jgi:hypothetical protein
MGVTNVNNSRGVQFICNITGLAEVSTFRELRALMCFIMFTADKMYSVLTAASRQFVGERGSAYKCKGNTSGNRWRLSVT